MLKKNYLLGFSATCFVSTLYLVPWRLNLSPNGIAYSFFLFPTIGGSLVTFGLVSGFAGLLL